MSWELECDAAMIADMFSVIDAAMANKTDAVIENDYVICTVKDGRCYTQGKPIRFPIFGSEVKP